MRRIHGYVRQTGPNIYKELAHETPAEDAEGIEAVAYTIWITMSEVARVSQEITKATGNAIRSDAARIEKNQSVAKSQAIYPKESLQGLGELVFLALGPNILKGFREVVIVI